MSAVLTNVVKIRDGRLPVTALRGVSVSVAAGERVAVTGPSGSGKSTLLNLIGGLDVPTSGTVVVCGTDLTRLDEEGRSRFRRPARRQVAARVARCLSDVGLTARARHVPDELSGGGRERCAIARALVTDPDLMLADEATGNLDSETGEQVLSLLEELQQSRRGTLVIVTHDARAAGRCERIIRMADGQITAEPR